MPKTKEQKKKVVDQLKEKFGKAKSVVFADFQGLKVSEIEELRNKCHEQDIDYTVAKKTLLRLALKEAELKDIEPKEILGSLATVFGAEDEVAPAKLLAEFAKTHQALEIKAGILEGKLVGADVIIALSKVPSKPELYAKLVGTINAPISGFVNILAGNLRSLVYALNAIKQSKS
ncbi:50S ribosomal protein L10 [Patescibacteria group bacterium]|nr:50S ribosomal protein L10 [Patescibacteria group bacterium]MBU1921938.1 50S ribosomal protein L10 [Patescibacteria group bacterium]